MSYVKTKKISLKAFQIITIFFFTLLSILSIISCSNDSESITEETPTEENPDNPEEETPTTGTGKPNILLIIADDMGMDASPYDTSFNTVRTLKPAMPNVEKLYTDGIRFENAWVYSTCSPTRASIITGKVSTQTGVNSPQTKMSDSELVLQKHINNNTNNAYQTGVFGKWHLSTTSAVIEPLGIDKFKGSSINVGGVTDYYNWTLEEDGVKTPITDYYTTTAYTDYAIDWIKDTTKPWFCWVAYNAAHTASGQFHTPEDSNSYTTTGSNNLRKYMQMLEAMDYEIGRLLDSLDEETKKNTTIIFMGDNGTPGKAVQLPFTNTTAKGSLHSGGVNVPFVISGYGVDRKNVSETALIQGTDLFSTISDLCGISNPNTNESISFKSLLSNSGTSLRKINFSASPSGYTLRNDAYKLNIIDNVESLYKVSSDYTETNNLIGQLGTNTEAKAAYDELKQEYNRLVN